MKKLIFEGPNKSGKTTLMKALNGNNEFTIDRGTGSSMVFDLYYKRDVDLEELWELDRWFADGGFKVVYVTADDDVLRKRTDEVGDEVLDVERIKTLYSMYLAETEMEVIRIDTTNSTIEESLQELLSKI